MSMNAGVEEHQSHASELTPLLNQNPRHGIPSSEAEDVMKSPVFWHEMRTIFLYALPIYGAQIIEMSLSIVPIISIGHLSTTALAGITLGSMTSGVTGRSILVGLISALDTLLPSTWTSPQPHLMGLWAQRMWVVLMITTIPISFIWYHAEPILLALKQDPEIAHLAAVYLRWMILGLPAMSFALISRRYYQAQGLLSLQTWISLCVAPVNVLVNYLLVWGPESIRLGFIGAPITTVISYYFWALLSILCGVYYVPRKGWHPISSRMFTNLGVVFRLGISGVSQIASEWWAWEFLALASSFLGPVALASQSILITSASVLFQAPFGLVLATTIRVGNLLGEKDSKRAEIATNASLVLTLFICSLISLALLVFRGSWAYIFNNDPDVVKTVASVLPVIAIYQVFGGIATAGAGILRVKGEQHIGALLNLSAFYVVGLPFGFWLAFSRHQGLVGVWIGLSVALFYSAVVGFYLCMQTNWDWEVQKVMKRLEDEERLRKPTDEEVLT